MFPRTAMSTSNVISGIKHAKGGRKRVHQWTVNDVFEGLMMRYRVMIARDKKIIAADDGMVSHQWERSRSGQKLGRSDELTWEMPNQGGMY
jgi:hypothetical protein